MLAVEDIDVVKDPELDDAIRLSITDSTSVGVGAEVVSGSGVITSVGDCGNGCLFSRCTKPPFSTWCHRADTPTRNSRNAVKNRM
jgi:hypothetical protein